MVRFSSSPTPKKLSGIGQLCIGDPNDKYCMNLFIHLLRHQDHPILQKGEFCVSAAKPPGELLRCQTPGRQAAAGAPGQSRRKARRCWFQCSQNILFSWQQEGRCYSAREHSISAHTTAPVQHKANKTPVLSFGQKRRYCKHGYRRGFGGRQEKVEKCSSGWQLQVPGQPKQK